MRQMKPADRQGKIVVVVGTVTNDVRILTVPKMTVRRSSWYDGQAMNVVAPGLCTEVY